MKSERGSEITEREEASYETGSVVPSPFAFPFEHTLVSVEQRDNGSRNLPVRRDVRRCTGQFSEIAPLQVR